MGVALFHGALAVVCACPFAAGERPRAVVGPHNWNIEVAAAALVALKVQIQERGDEVLVDGGDRSLRQTGSSKLSRVLKSLSASGGGGLPPTLCRAFS